MTLIDIQLSVEDIKKTVEMVTHAIYQVCDVYSTCKVRSALLAV